MWPWYSSLRSCRWRLKVTAAGGVPVVAQVYFKLPSPVSTSAPSTERLVVVPVTVLGVVLAPSLPSVRGSEP